MIGACFERSEDRVGDFEWEKKSLRPSSRMKTACEKFLQLLRDHVSQMQREPTREGRVLDLFCTNKPSLVTTITMPLQLIVI